MWDAITHRGTSMLGNTLMIESLRARLESDSTLPLQKNRRLFIYIPIRTNIMDHDETN
jgi:hypothetical protein